MAAIESGMLRWNDPRWHRLLGAPVSEYGLYVSYALCRVARQADLGGLLHRGIGRLCAFQNLVDEYRGPPEQIRRIGAIGHEAANVHLFPGLIHGG